MMIVALAGWPSERVWATEFEYPELERLYREVVDLHSQILDERGRIQVLTLETMLLEQQLQRDSSQQSEPAPHLLPVVRAEWTQSGNARNESLDSHAAAQAAVLVDARRQWEQAQYSGLRFREHARRIESRLGVDVGVTRSLSWVSLLCWLAPSIGLLALVSWLLQLHERRIEWRKTVRSQSFLRNGSAAVLAALMPLTLAGCGGQHDLTPLSTWQVRQVAELSRLKSQLTVELEDTRSRRMSLSEQLRGQRVQVFSRLEQIFGNGKGDGPTAVAGVLVAGEKESMKRLESLLLVDALLELYEQDVGTVANELARRGNELTEFVAAQQTRTQTISIAAVGTVGVSFLLCMIPFVRARRSTTKRLSDNRRICPRCLAAGTLKITKSTFECSECDGRMPSNLLDGERLCFPTVGVRSGGKTHFILEFYDQIRNKATKVAARMSWVPSFSDVEKSFDIMLKNLRKGKRPDPTEADPDRIPEPLLFTIRDRALFPPNSLNLLLFDLGGEVMNMHIDKEKLKERAMKMDGFLLFLDPQQVLPDNGNFLTKDDQLKMLCDQSAQMKAVRGIQHDGVLDVPVAVCIPKLDLIPRHNPLAGAGHELLDKLRKTENEPVTLDLLETRSKIVGQFLKEMFLGWDVERDLKDNFGARFLFFPLTPVNIIETEIGIDDLNRRSLKPFGIQEPFLWLLHISGYQVLK